MIAQNKMKKRNTSKAPYANVIDNLINAKMYTRPDLLLKQLVDSKTTRYMPVVKLLGEF